MFFNRFIFILRQYDLQTGLQSVIDFYTGMQRGLARDLDELYSLAALCFVRKVSQMDRFERAFVFYFTGVELPGVAYGDPNLVHTPEYKKWLSNAILKRQINPISMNLTIEELMERFWNTVNSQLEEHHGGSKWIGTGGTSPYGHSGNAMGGVRVHGESQNKSANKVFAQRRYVSYSDDLSIQDAPVSRILQTMKSLVPHGPATELNIYESVYQSAKNAGEIELVFQKPLRDKLEIILFMDNGGTSMLPFVEICRNLFRRIQNRFKYCDNYYFHNSIYKYVYSDDKRQKPVLLSKALSKMNDPTVIIIGDAVMGPQELYSPYGAIDQRDECHEASLYWLAYLKKNTKRVAWLNPIPSRYWENNGSSWTLQKIREMFFMQDMSLGGLKKAVDFLSAYE